MMKASHVARRHYPTAFVRSLQSAVLHNLYPSLSHAANGRFEAQFLCDEVPFLADLQPTSVQESGKPLAWIFSIAMTPYPQA